MRQRDHGPPVQLVAAAYARSDPGQPEQALDGEPPDGNDQPRTENRELPFAPERAELLLARGRRAVAATGGSAPRIATGDGRAVERLVELVLVQLEPAPERLPRAAAPRSPLLSFDDPGRLAVHVRGLAGVHVAYGPRFEWIA